MQVTAAVLHMVSEFANLRKLQTSQFDRNSKEQADFFFFGKWPEVFGAVIGPACNMIKSFIVI